MGQTQQNLGWCQNIQEGQSCLSPGPKAKGNSPEKLSEESNSFTLIHEENWWPFFKVWEKAENKARRCFRLLRATGHHCVSWWYCPGSNTRGFCNVCRVRTCCSWTRYAWTGRGPPSAARETVKYVLCPSCGRGFQRSKMGPLVVSQTGSVSSVTLRMWLRLRRTRFLISSRQPRLLSLVR